MSTPQPEAPAHGSVGITVGPRQGRVLDRTLARLGAAGFPLPRRFTDGDASTPEGFPVTRRVPRIGGWPNFWLGLTELVARDPAADAFLIVQDDVVFCRNTYDYVRTLTFPADCGAVSLFCAACYNGPRG